MGQEALIPHLFRMESSKITAVLCKVFGLENIESAEDITSETFAAALETWPHRGIPENPKAWLYTVAKNKARNYLNRHQHFREKIRPELENKGAESEEWELDLSEKSITDSQLQMLFAVCHPVISTEAQIGLALRILCGFGIQEIADAFLTSKETINKRLYRAKEKLREENIQLVLPPEAEIQERLDAVLLTLYLLFNEGYYSESQDTIIRKDLCLEAMRLTRLLLDHVSTNVPRVNALFALMCFHSSRLDARKDQQGQQILYKDQDESLWNQELITLGAQHLREASIGQHASKYHYEASIAYWQTIKADTPEKWQNILNLYNQLLILQYSPIAALNRTYAYAKVYGHLAAIPMAEKLQLTGNHYYFMLLGTLYQGIDDGQAKWCFERALELARTEGDREVIKSKINLS